MRAMPDGLQAMLESGAATTCRCWRIGRADGVVLGFTDHDRALSFDGVVYEAESGIDASGIEAATGLAVDTATLTGALRSAAISDRDVERGLYEGAEVAMFLVDWSAPANRVLVSAGTIGDVRRARGAFEAEVVGLAERLNQPVGRAYTATCDARLGDARCGVDVAAAAFSATATVTGAPRGHLVVVAGLQGFAPQWFAGGVARWATGANAGAVGHIKTSAPQAGAVVLEFWVSPPLAVLVGDTLVAVAGCDKRAATCRAKFANFANFRGFPHMPGDDWATNYPSSGGVHDGGSLYRGRS